MSVENYAYMRRLWEHRRALYEHGQETTEHIEEISPSQSAGRPSSEQANLPLQRSESGSATQGDERPLRLARTFVPARLRETKSLVYQSSSNNDPHSDHAPRILPSFFSPPTTIATRQGISEPITTSTTTTGDPAKYIFQSYSALLTNTLSLVFELNPLLNITHPLLSKHHSRRGQLRILDLGGIEGSMLTTSPSLLCIRCSCLFWKNRCVHTGDRYSTKGCSMPAHTTTAIRQISALFAFQVKELRCGYHKNAL